MRHLKKTLILILNFSLLIFNLTGCATVPYEPKPTGVISIPAAGIYHEVRQGDTLWRIAQAYRIDIEALAMVNHISDATKINPGQRLFIPAAKTPLLVTPEEKFIYEKDLFIWPLKGEIASYFNEEIYGSRNKGIDVKAGEGTPVVASKSGRVAFSNENFKGLGKIIIIDHPDGFTTVYARNSQNLVKAGDRVEQNQLIAKVGASGRGAAAYLHFEIRRRQKPQNPLYYLP